MILATGLGSVTQRVMLVKGRMPHAFIPTLATLNAARGLALFLSDGAPMPGMPSIVTTVGAEDAGSHRRA